MQRVLRAIGIAVAGSVAIVCLAALNFPAVVVQAIVLALAPSWTNVLLLVGAVLLSFAAKYSGNGFFFGRSILHARLFLEGEVSYLRRVPPDRFKSLLPESLWALFARPFSVWTYPRRLTVSVVRGQQDAVLAYVCSFRSLSGESFIFLPDDPAKLTVFQRFCFLREVSHAATPSEAVSRSGQEVVWMTTALWIALLAQWRADVALPLLLALAALWTLIVDNELISESRADAAIRDQMTADAAALAALPTADLPRLDACLAEYPLRDAVARDDPEQSDDGSVFERMFMPRYATSIDFSNGLRTYVLRRSIRQRLYGEEPPAKTGNELPLHRSLIPVLLTPVLSLAACTGIALIGQSAGGWRLIATASLTVIFGVNAIRSWRYVLRRRKTVQELIDQLDRENATEAARPLGDDGSPADDADAAGQGVLTNACAAGEYQA